MANPKYYFPIRSNQRPIRHALSAKGKSYDVHWGVDDKLQSILGQPNTRVKMASSEQEVMAHFQRYDDPNTEVTFYNSLFGEFYTRPDIPEDNRFVATDFSFHPSDFVIEPVKGIATLMQQHGLFADKTSARAQVASDTTAGIAINKDSRTNKR